MIVVTKKSKPQPAFARYEATKAAKEMPAMAPPDPYEGLTRLESAKQRLREAGDVTAVWQDGHKVELFRGRSRTPEWIISEAEKLPAVEA